MNNRSLAKLASAGEVARNSELRTAAYLEVREDSSTESTHKFSAKVELQKRSNITKRPAHLDPARLMLLNNGVTETTNLKECLAVDFSLLLPATLPELDKSLIHIIERQKSLGISKRMVMMGQLLLEHLGPSLIKRLQSHPADTVRGWACFMIGAIGEMTLADRLAAIRPLADDRHFGVREWAWMALRQHFTLDLATAIELLSEWTHESSERLRRFASEAIRPRGVWCSHILRLKQHPELALPLLEKLRADPAKYVQDSVGNWLNDASKDQPDWVSMLCNRWLFESPALATQKICKRGLRSLNRKN